MVYEWELKKVKDWDVSTIKNHIWLEEECGQPIPGCVSVEALKAELERRGEEPVGYHHKPKKRVISLQAVRKMNCDTFSKKDNSVRGYSTIIKCDVRVGDEIILDNHFTLVTE